MGRRGEPIRRNREVQGVPSVPTDPLVGEAQRDVGVDAPRQGPRQPVGAGDGIVVRIGVFEHQRVGAACDTNQLASRRGAAIVASFEPVAKPIGRAVVVVVGRRAEPVRYRFGKRICGNHCILHDCRASGDKRHPGRQGIGQFQPRQRHGPGVLDGDVIVVRDAVIPVRGQGRRLGHPHARRAGRRVRDPRRDPRRLLIALKPRRIDEFRGRKRIVDGRRQGDGHVRARRQRISRQQTWRCGQSVGGVCGRDGDMDVVEPDNIGGIARCIAAEANDRAGRRIGRNVERSREIGTVVRCTADLPHLCKGAPAVRGDIDIEEVRRFQRIPAVIHPQRRVRVAVQVRCALHDGGRHRPQGIGLPGNRRAVHRDAHVAAGHHVVVADLRPGPRPNHVAIAVGVGLQIKPVFKFIRVAERPVQLGGAVGIGHAKGQEILQPDARLGHRAGVGDQNRIGDIAAPANQIGGAGGLQQSDAGGGVDPVRYRI